MRLQGPVRHLFADGVVLGPGEVVVVFDRGEHAVTGAQSASTGALSLNNDADTVTLTDAAGAVIDQVSYGPAPVGISLNRSEDGGVDSPLVAHDTLPAAAGPSSPGTRADGRDWIEVPPQVVVLLNELLPDPEGTDLGQEFVEIVNAGAGAVELQGWSLGDAVEPVRHRFDQPLRLEPGQAVVVFDRGEHGDVPGPVILASSGVLSLNNGSDVVTLYDASGGVVDSVLYEATTPGVSLNRARDGAHWAEWIGHDAVAGSTGRSSPGTRVDGSGW